MNPDFFTIIGVLFTIFSLIIITFSLTVIVVIVYNWRSEFRSTANLLICNSSASLLFYSVTLTIQIPFIFQGNILSSDETNTTFCRIRSFIATYATLIKSYSYLTMAISCFLLTILYKYRILQSFRVHWMIIIISWIFSGIITFGTFMSPGAYAYEPESGLCFLTTKKFATSFTVVTLVFVLTLGIIITLYGIIMRHIVANGRNHANRESVKRAKRNLIVFKKIFIYVSILLVGGTPYFLCSILHQLGKVPWPLYATVHLFVAFSAALESMALLLTNKQVTKILLAKFRGNQINPLNTTNTFQVGRTMSIHNRRHTNAILPVIN